MDVSLLVRDGDGTVTREEVATAAAHLQETLDKEGLQELISKLSKDKGSCYTCSFLFL